MFELTGFQRDLLYVIAGSERPSGQEIKEKIGKDVGEVNHGRLYPNLDALVEEGLVDKGQQDRRTNYYTISESGRQAIRKRREWENQYVSLDE
ncbi:PadR family transcriptional regulator [Halogeometricum borinquense]|uniref:Transcriptional regulator, PadR family n=2 Tax=Halogeometricum borinquense TaxID=60847 RepID=E4NWE4_HALBP|nr:PadR family transcriptional regulator [Halogeometricum borinquense]ADQ69364.1 transcriptional regulator, PadR family [Halogeometricum borinquense DSM 11551]ELY26253.1 transcriptional regulator, PadR family protein [Halogeometricum borinquense DSM 11551]QIB73973.1 PadR family transcriptional regulator [Halogeometricum borinquense]RYJ19587.1 PadR family transcriptional regulator [Halogeometricum borinquense]